MEYTIAFMIAFAFIICKVTSNYKNNTCKIEKKDSKTIRVLDVYESNSILIKEYIIPKKSFIDVGNVDFDF